MSTLLADAGEPRESQPAILRLVCALSFAGIVTGALFFLMQALIASSNARVDEGLSINLVDFVRTPENIELTVKERKVRRPPEPDEMPPPADNPGFDVAVEGHAWNLEGVSIDHQAVDHFSFVSDGNYLPIVKVQPVYPRVALTRGYEGWVVLEFTVDELGRVVEPAVVDHCAHAITPGEPRDECQDKPNSVFDRTSLQASTRFKYKPRIVEGVAVATPHVRHKLTFVLDR